MTISHHNQDQALHQKLALCYLPIFININDESLRCIWFFFLLCTWIMDNWDQVPYLKQVIRCILLYIVHKPIVKSDFWIFSIKKLKNFRLTCMYFKVDREVNSFLPLQLVTWSIKIKMSYWSLKHINIPITFTKSHLF